jgi:hypothetical protein
MPIRRTGSIKCPLGDCFSASGEQVETVTVVDCEQAHIYEVFAIFDHEVGADQPYPGDDELLKYADTACQPLFEGLRRDRLPSRRSTGSPQSRRPRRPGKTAMARSCARSSSARRART